MANQLLYGRIAQRVYTSIWSSPRTTTTRAKSNIREGSYEFARSVWPLRQDARMESSKRSRRQVQISLPCKKDRNCVRYSRTEVANHGRSRSRSKDWRWMLI